MSNLQEKHCIPCEVGGKPLTHQEIQTLLSQINSEWNVLDDKKIAREFSFKNFKEAMVFVNTIADIAEAEQHHPDMHIFYNKVNVELWTHAVGGLSENDFIVAAKIDAK